MSVTLPTTARPPEPARPAVPTARRPRRVARAWLLILPTFAFLALLYGYPVYDILKQSVTDFVRPQHAGLDNYSWFFDTPANVRILVRTLVTGAVVTAGTLVLAYPYAYYMTVVGPRLRRLLFVVVLVPFWTSLMVRNFAWIILLQPNGPVDDVLHAVGLGSPQLLGTLAGVTIGEIQILLPFVVLPLYARLRGVDRRLLAAAESLGAPPWRAFLRVYLPLSLPGVLAGGLLAYVLSLGFYITPALLGSSRNQLLSPLIVTQVDQLLAFGRGGALAMVLLVAAFGLVALTYGISRKRLGSSDGSAVEPDGPAEQRSRRPVLAALTALVGVVLVLPSLIIVPMSFTGRKTFAFPPTHWSTRWWTELFANQVWVNALLNSLAIAVTTAVLATLFGTTAALGLSRITSGAGALNGLFLVPLVAPVVVAAIGIYSVFLRWHLTGTFVGLVCAHTSLAIPYVIVPVAASLRGFDRRLEAAATSLGAGPWSTFRAVTLPLILPGVVAGALFAFATSLDETVVSLFLVSPQLRTLPVQVFTSVTRDIDPTVAAASTVVFTITTTLVLTMFAVQARRERRGVG